jgi:hypothetical protein
MSLVAIRKLIVRYNETKADLQPFPERPKQLIYLTDHISHGSDEGRVIKETFIRQLELNYGMRRVNINFSDEVVKSGYNASQLNKAYEQIYSWVSRSIICFSSVSQSTDTLSTNIIMSLRTLSPNIRLRLRVDFLHSMLLVESTFEFGQQPQIWSCTISP